MNRTYYENQTSTASVTMRIYITKKSVTWEEMRTLNLDDVMAGAEPTYGWRYYMRQALPLKPEHAERLRGMYGLPDAAVAHLKGEQ